MPLGEINHRWTLIDQVHQRRGKEHLTFESQCLHHHGSILFPLCDAVVGQLLDGDHARPIAGGKEQAFFLQGLLNLVLGLNLLRLAAFSEIVHDFHLNVPIGLTVFLEQTHDAGKGRVLFFRMMKHHHTNRVLDGAKPLLTHGGERQGRVLMPYPSPGVA